MTIQPEAILEAELVKQLNDLGHHRIIIRDKTSLQNLQKQLEKHNNIMLSDKEFGQILNHLNKGNVFERAKILREKAKYNKDDGTTGYLEFINQEHWCQNQFQVTSQVSMQGSYKNRYDVTILINGLPLVQIELKRRGLNSKKHLIKPTVTSDILTIHLTGLFNYIQLFVISNGVNTKYFANNRKQDFDQTFYWADTENKRITQLSQFAQIFLEPCHVSKMITKFIILNET